MTTLPFNDPPIDPATYLEVARRLSKQRPQAARRSAIDRAYYAAHLMARDVLRAKGYVERLGANEHDKINDALNQLDPELGAAQKLLRDARARVTYNTGAVSFQRGESPRWAVNVAAMIIDYVNGLPDAE